MNLRFTFKRLFHYEFWSLWVFYAPFGFQWLWNSIRSGSVGYFMKANPGIKFGGLFQNSKYALLKQLHPDYIPQTIFFESLNEEALHAIEQMEFPFICKPDIGERGKGVQLIRNQADWLTCKKQLEEPFLIQEYIDYEIELGVLYYRFPKGESGISSIVSKGFLEVVGDGESNIKTLIVNHLRASKQQTHLFKKFKDQLETVPEKGEQFLLEEIGNHCRGTTFFNSNELINEDLVKVFDKILGPLHGFYYGRVDFKVKSIADLYEGKNIKILEVNGVNSEATHIYDPDYTLFEAYRDVAYNLNLVYRISQQNKDWADNYTLKEFYQATKKQFSKGKHDKEEEK